MIEQDIINLHKCLNVIEQDSYFSPNLKEVKEDDCSIIYHFDTKIVVDSVIVNEKKKEKYKCAIQEYFDYLNIES